MFKHILVPTDGSPLSEKTVLAAAALAKENGARITGFYAQPESHSYITEGLRVDDQLWHKATALAEAQARQALDFVTKACQSAGVESKTQSAASDQPYAAIIAAAESNACDLIFMASHGRRGLSAVLLGSETHKVLTHSKIPVLVFR